MTRNMACVLITLCGAGLLLTAGGLAFISHGSTLENDFSVVPSTSSYASANDLFSISSTFMNLGTIDDNGVAYARAVITNVSDVPIYPKLHISCGCFAGSIDKTVIDPGEKATVVAVVQAHLRSEAQQDRVTQDLLVTASTKEGRTAREKITGTVAVTNLVDVAPRGAIARRLDRPSTSNALYTTSLEILPTAEGIDVDVVEVAAINKTEPVSFEWDGTRVTLRMTPSTLEASSGTSVILKLSLNSERIFLLVPLLKETTDDA